MKKRRGRLISALLAATALLLAGACLYSGLLFPAQADTPDRDQYYDMVAQCISEDINPLSDEDIELMVRKRLGSFALTEAETDAIINVLDGEEVSDVYRDLYLISLFEYDCNTKENHATSYYSVEDNTVHIGKNVAPNNFIATFFHESGHAIQVSLWDKDSEAADKAEAFRFCTETEIYKALFEDVENEILSCAEALDEGNLSNKELQAVADAFINASFEPVYNTDDLPDPDLISGICSKVAQFMYDELSQIPNSNASMVSDVYGGITNNKILGGMGHPVQKTNPDGTVTSYWYDENGQTTYNQLTEGWAEYFSAKVTADELNIELNARYFPEAACRLEDLANELLDYYVFTVQE